MLGLHVMAGFQKVGVLCYIIVRIGFEGMSDSFLIAGTCARKVFTTNTSILRNILVYYYSK